MSLYGLVIFFYRPKIKFATSYLKGLILSYSSWIPLKVLLKPKIQMEVEKMHLRTFPSPTQSTSPFYLVVLPPSMRGKEKSDCCIKGWAKFLSFLGFANIHEFSGDRQLDMRQSNKNLELFPETLVSFLDGSLGGLETLEVFFSRRSLGVNIFWFA